MADHRHPDYDRGRAVLRGPGAPLPPPAAGICLPDGSIPGKAAQPAAGQEPVPVWDPGMTQKVAITLVAQLAGETPLGAPNWDDALEQLREVVKSKVEPKTPDDTMILEAVRLCGDMAARAKKIVERHVKAREKAADEPS